MLSKVRSRALAPLWVFWIVASSASAEAPPPTAEAIEIIVVTASATPREIDKLPGTVDVISREEIELHLNIEVADALRNLAGLHLDQPGGRGGRASLYLHGLDPNQTIVGQDHRRPAQQTPRGVSPRRASRRAWRFLEYPSQ